MEVLLFLGLLVLAALVHRQSSRLSALEQLVGRLDLAEGSSDPLFEERPPPARVVRSQAQAAAEPAGAAVATESDARWWQGKEEEEPFEPGPAGETLGVSFERLVGGRLLIWIGGIALAVAGIFLVRHSIQIGLITPGVQMVMAALFGSLLLAAGELARRRPGASPDPRVAQALIGAGILVLYATPYGSLVVYGLISNGTATALMAMVTAAALFLSLRHGAPSAVLGLLGGFATPLLVGERTDTALPLLAYLGLLDIVLFTLAGRRGWTWLAAAAALLSYAWTASLLFWPRDDALAAGLFVVALGVAASVARAGEGWQLPFLRPAAIGLLQLAVLVARADLGLPAWGLFGLLAAASLFLSTRRPEYRFLPALALGLALALLAAKAFAGADPNVPPVAAAITLLFGGGALVGALRGPDRLLWTATGAAAFAGPAILLRIARPELLERPAWGDLFLLLAVGPVFLAWSRRAAVQPRAADPPLFVAGAAALLLLGLGAFDLVPRELLAGAWLLLATAAALAARRLGDSGAILLALLAVAAAGLWAVAMVPELWSVLAGSLAGLPALASELPPVPRALQVLLLPVPLLVIAWRLLPSGFPRSRPLVLALAGILAAAAAYILFKQVFRLAGWDDFLARGFAERLLITQALFAAGWVACTGRIAIPSLGERHWRLAGTILTALAAARLLWFDILIHNPALVGQRVGPLPVFNLLAPAYLLSAFWLYRMRRGTGSETRSGVWLVLFLAALVVGAMLMVRQLFHGAVLTAPDLTSAESYGYSLAGLLLSIALLLAGIKLADKALRLAGLILLTATILKVFLSDASALEGVLRILSFLGLGVALIGIGRLYTRVLNAEARPAGG
jgi:uncharacterized membrane protein